jgi:xylulokinase
LHQLNELAATAPPGSGGVIFTPWLYGERTPVEDATLRAGFFNQSLETGRAEMARAVFEGVAYNSRWLLGYVERLAGHRLDPIVIAGGGARSDLWCQIFADVLGRTIKQAADPIMVNARGAGLLAHAALDNVAWDDIPRLVPITADYPPNPQNSPIYDRLYDAFRRIQRNNQRTYRKLNR